MRWLGKCFRLSRGPPLLPPLLWLELIGRVIQERKRCALKLLALPLLEKTLSALLGFGSPCTLKVRKCSRESSYLSPGPHCNTELERSDRYPSYFLRVRALSSAGRRYETLNREASSSYEGGSARVANGVRSFSSRFHCSIRSWWHRRRQTARARAQFGKPCSRQNAARFRPHMLPPPFRGEGPSKAWCQTGPAGTSFNQYTPRKMSMIALVWSLSRMRSLP